MAGTITASIVKNDTTSPPQFQNSAGSEVGTLCRAWVNFNGLGAATIRSSFNVSSVTYNSTGVYTVSFTTAMTDVNYAVTGSAMFSGVPDGNTAVIGPRRGVTAYNTGNIVLQSSSPNAASLSDVLYANVAVFR